MGRLIWSLVFFWPLLLMTSLYQKIAVVVLWMVCCLWWTMPICMCFSWLKFLAEVGVSQNQVSNSRESPTEAGKLNLLPSPLSIGVLQEIARRCSSKVRICFDLTRDTIFFLSLAPHPTKCCSSRSVLLCRLSSGLFWVPVRICNFLLRSVKPCFLTESYFASLVLSESTNEIVLCCAIEQYMFLFLSYDKWFTYHHQLLKL